jgi:predicted Zn-dependent protease
LAAAGRTAEAVTVLEPHSSAVSGVLAGHLIDIGRVKEAVALLQRREPRPVAPPRSGASDDPPPF